MSIHLVIDENDDILLKAQNYGIQAARDRFNSLLESQPLFFSWDEEIKELNTTVFKIMLDIFKYNIPVVLNKDYINKFLITFKNSFKIEYNLLTKEKSPLPIIQPDDNVAINLLVQKSTTALFRNVSRKSMEESTLGGLREMSLAELDKVISRFPFKLAVQEAAFYELNTLWDEQKTVNDAVTSFHLVNFVHLQ